MSIEIIQLIANLIVVPMVATLWQINSRLSRIEGHLNAIDNKT